MSASGEAGSYSELEDDSERGIDGAYASEFETGDTERLLADGEMVGSWSEEEEEGGLLAGDETVGQWSASDEETDDDMDDRSMRAHGTDREMADGQHGLSGGRQEPGSGPRHR